MTVINTPTGIKLYQFATMVMHLRLQAKGMTGPPVLKLLRKMYGYHGTIKTASTKVDADYYAWRGGKFDDIKSDQLRSLIEAHGETNDRTRP